MDEWEFDSIVITPSAFSKDWVCKKPDFPGVVSRIHRCYSKLEWYKSKSWVHNYQTISIIPPLHIGVEERDGSARTQEERASHRGVAVLLWDSIGTPVTAAVRLHIWQCKYVLHCNVGHNKFFYFI
jgi:hypothetical protein